MKQMVVIKKVRRINWKVYVSDRGGIYIQGIDGRFFHATVDNSPLPPRIKFVIIK